ncbi:MAG TPA: M1 family aminopeptidase [Rhizomicrobium sp.]
MFRRIAGFELRYQLTSPVLWVSFGIFFLLTFGATTIPQIQIGDKGNTNINAPAAIVQMLQIMSIFAIFIFTAFVANVVVRDDETGYGPILRATPVRKFDYLFGRFTGAFVAGLIAFASAPLGILVGTLMPWLDPVKLGPFHAGYYLYAYFFMAAPTLFVMAAGFFALATATRSIFATYVGAVAFLVFYFVLTGLFDRPQYDHIIGLLEPFGIGAVSEATKYWTASDRNTMLPPFSGIVLENRLIWFSLSFLLLAVAFGCYRFAARGRRSQKPAPRDTFARSRTGPLPAPRYDASATRIQLWKWTRFEMAQVFRSPAFFVLLAIGLLNALGSLWYADTVRDYQILPVTRVMIEALRGAFTIIPVIIAIYYAGELVWRERDRRTHEIFDACPVADWIFVLPKIAAIGLVLLSTFLISVAVAVAVQALKGYHLYELDHYLLWYVVPEAIWAIELAAFAIFVQSVSPQKYVGWGIMALYLVARVTFVNIGFEHHLYLFGPLEVPLSDMNGEGQFWIKRAWLDVYWGAFTLMLAVLAYALWRRGTETRLSPRLARLPGRLKGMGGGLMAVAFAIFAASGAYIYYNTNILNEYRTTIGDDDLKAKYEKTVLRFETLPKPRVTDITLNVAVFPHAPRVETTGTLAFQNRTAKPLTQMHVRWDRDLEMRSLKVEGARPVRTYGVFHYAIFAFGRPLAPGQRGMLHFRSVLEQRGFKNSGDTTRMVDNGTFVDSFDIAPVIGMDRQGGLLTDPSKRRRHGLPAELRPPKLENDSARQYNYLRHDADWVNSDITVSTVADQTPIAPGYKVSESVSGGRRTVRFKSDAEILPFFSIQSARYSVKRAKWRDVDLAVYYDARHPYDIDRMIAAMKASLDVYTRAFGPYQFHQLRILEFPAYANFAQSFANTVPYSEGIGFIQNFAAVKSDPDKIDLVTFVTAHEIGHQWWAHQVIGADMQGDTMLSETFAQYSAMLVMEHLYGPEHVRKFLKYSLDHYLRARGGEEIEELPLERVEDQGYIHYDKGAVVMYRLKEAVGEDVVDRSLRRLLAQYAFKPAPYPSSKDFVRILRQEAGPRYDQLITDLFEKITIYDLKATDVRFKKRADGKYDVALTVEAHKFYADGKGKERETAMNEAVPVGAFLVEPGKQGFDRSKILSLRDAQIGSGRQTLHLIVNRAPAFAGIDPYNEWIDRNSDDNVMSASAAPAS